MLLLIVDIARDLWDLVLANRDDAVALLPVQLQTGLDFLVDSKGAGALEFADKVSDRDGGRKPDQQMACRASCYAATGLRLVSRFLR
jgi:hypothetical protein